MFDPALLDTLIRDSSDPVLVLADKCSVVQANPAFLDLVPGAHVGADFMGLVEPSARERVLKQLVKAAAGDPVLLDVPHGGTRGEGAWIEYRFFPLEGGRVAGIGRPRGEARTAHEALGRAEAELKAKTRMLDEIQLELTQVPFIDPITGVWNRMQVIERLTGEWSRCERYGSPLTCLLVAVEPLARIRKEHGTAIADEILKTIARRLKSVVRDHDIVGRYSADTFVIIAVHSDTRGAFSLAHRIHERVALEPASVDHRIFEFQLMIGGATNRSEGVEILEDLFSVSEGALEDARQSGGDAAVVREVPA